MEERLVEVCFGTAQVPRDVDLDDEGSVLDHFVRVLLGDDDPDDPANSAFGVRAAMRTAVTRQLLADPPFEEAIEAATRGLDAGLSPQDTLIQLSAVTLSVLARSAESGMGLGRMQPEDGEIGLAKLLYGNHELPELYASVPLPGAIELRTEFIGVVRASPGITCDAAVEAARERIARPGDQADVVGTMLDHTMDRAIQSGALVILAGDRLADRWTLLSGAITTHRINEDDEAIGLTLFDDDLVTLVPPMDEDGQLSDEVQVQFGVEGIPVGTLVTVGFVGSAISLGAVPSDEVGFAEAEPALIDLVRGCFEASHDSNGGAVDLDDLVVAVELADPGVWSRPHPPVVEVVAAAGLQLRRGMVAADDETWRYEQKLRIEARLMRALDLEDQDSGALLEVVDEMLGGDAEDQPRRLTRDAVTALRSSESGPVLIEALMETDLDDEFDVLETRALLESLLEHARRDDERMLALWLISIYDERCGLLTLSERRIAEANRIEPDFKPVLERVGWFAFLRGDAAAALHAWRRLGRANDREMVIAERLGSPTSSRLGRNDPCWCGSGRKFKACHLGAAQPVTPADRVEWLWAKSVGYMIRSGDLAISDIAELCEALVEDASDERQLQAAFTDPVILDFALVYFEWFASFVEHAGEMLPADDLELARSWLPVQRSVFEVVEQSPDSTTLRDIAGGEVVEVRGGLPGRSVTAGEMWSARVVPDGGAHQCVGGVFRIPADEVDEVFALLVDGAPVALCEWLRDNRPRR